MRRGEFGENEHERNVYSLIARFALARNAKDGPYRLNSISIEASQPKTALKQKVTLHDDEGNAIEVTGAAWATEAAELSAAGKLLYNKEPLLGDVPDIIRQMVAREAVAIISGHDELVALWEKEHAEWLKQKAESESTEEHRKYLALRPVFEQFEQDCGGKIGKRRERWNLYLDWLQQHPRLARDGVTFGNRRVLEERASWQCRK